jgi:hypothetical protein
MDIEIATARTLHDDGGADGGHHDKPPTVGGPTGRRRHTGWGGLRDTAGALLGAALGLLPHLMHHVSIFAGALVVTGATGNLLFGALGLLMSIPLLRRLWRRFGTWKAPALALAVFAALFSLSTFVVGPAITGDAASTPERPVSETPDPGGSPNEDEHVSHHTD